MERKQIVNKLNDLDEESAKIRREQEIADWLQSYAEKDRVVKINEILEELEKDKNRERYRAFAGIQSLDEIVGGFREGQLIVVSAETGQGKTTFCQTLTKNFYAKEINCLWFTYEVGIEEFIEKFEGQVPVFYVPRELRQNKMSWIETRIKEAIVKFDCKIVFIDHLHYLLEMQRMAEAKSISLLVGMMMRELKRITIENNVIIFLVSHMRKIDSEQMPEIDDLRDSSFVGQEADLVMFLKRRKVKNEEGQMIETNEAILRVAKNRRTGKLGYIKLIFSDNKFKELNNYEM